MTDKKSTTGQAKQKKKRSIPKARLLVETEAVCSEYVLTPSNTIGELITALQQSIVAEQVAALN